MASFARKAENKNTFTMAVNSLQGHWTLSVILSEKPVLGTVTGQSNGRPDSLKRNAASEIK